MKRPRHAFQACHRHLTPMWFLPCHGKRSVPISQRKMPNEYASLAVVSCLFPSCSGDMKPGVPTLNDCPRTLNGISWWFGLFLSGKDEAVRFEVV